MALDKIKQGRWTRQIHIARAGLQAGASWAGNNLGTYVLPPEQREEERARILAAQAERWVDRLGELKGSIVKIGQIMATYADYCLPAPIAAALHKLEGDTKPLSWSAISPFINASLHDKKSQLIIERSPIAAASLSQVHKTRIRDTGDVICLKILYPGIVDTLDSDLAVVKNSLAILLNREERRNLSLWIASIHSILLEELDLRQEASKLLAWSKRLSSDKRYIIPAVYEQYSSPTMLAMSYETGHSQYDDEVAVLSLKRRNAIAESMLELFLREIFIWGEMQTDPHPGNYRIRINKGQTDQIILLDFGSVRKIDKPLLLALRSMILSAYRADRQALLEAIFDMGLLDRHASTDSQNAFADVISGLVEPLNYKSRLAENPHSIPSCAFDKQGNYCWKAANLPKRMGKLAMKSAISKDFSFPGADFLFLSRKLAGVYAFIAALDARFDGGKVLEKVLAEARIPLR